MIVLVPEIALAPQTVGRFQARFGDRVAILHSSLSDAERRDERERIASGGAPIVIGARSAVFAPLPRLGLICVDEEHDAAYKQESDPRYDARTVAAKRASLEGAVAVYGSATPRPRGGRRSSGSSSASGSAPTCRPCGSSTSAARPAIRSRPRSWRAREAGREGAARRSSCSTAAGLPPRSTAGPAARRRCPNCDVALVLHRDGALHCHHCGFSEASPQACPAVRLGRPGARSAPAQRLERGSSARSRAGAVPARRRCGGEPGELAAALPASRPPTEPSSSGRRWWPRVITSPASRSRRWSTPTPGSASRTSAPRSARSNS